MSLTLIANSGIQFHRFPLVIDPNERVIPTMGFRERFDPNASKVTLDYAIYLPDHDVWVSKQSLVWEGWINDAGRLLDDRINLSILSPLDEELEFFPLSDIETSLEKFAGHWLPVPYFRTSGPGHFEFGPTDWARLYLKKVDSTHTPVRPKRFSYEVVLAFDTQLSPQFGSKESPFMFDNSSDNLYGFCQNPDLLLNFFDDQFSCGWVDDYIASVAIGGKANISYTFPSLKYLAEYIYLLRYLGATGKFPVVELFPNQKGHIDVDLVLDIGNSHTCGLLCETPVGSSFEFTAVKRLVLNDLTRFERTSNEPFSMQLAFGKASFGEIGYNNPRFQWPSMVRLGPEAAYLIHQSVLDMSRGVESATHHSSPKRYLWDDRRHPIQWEFTHLDRQRGPHPVYLRGISEQFYSDGRFTQKVDFGATSHFSRQSLMTFVFVEIFAQALCQINSHEFRFTHGHLDKPRRLRRVVVTCPTAMVQREQVTLRKCAEEAAITLKRFLTQTFEVEVNPASLGPEMEVVPSAKDSGKDLSQLATRKDWLYDEATCCQLVFLYGEVGKRYLNKSDIFFNLYGKYRNDLDGYQKKSITIGSIDIGAGTTDMMICAYKYDETGISVLTPKPLYWESFNLAGDDFLKKVVEGILLEGKPASEADAGCTGVIETHARSLGIPGVRDKMNNFFGTDSNNMGFVNRVMRKNFNTQVLVPMAKRYLEHARLNKPDEEVGFDYFFSENPPNQELLDFFASHFGFRFESIRWKLSSGRVNTLLEITFEPLLKLLATLAYAYGCDFMLLAGKPTSLSRIEDLFLKFFPVSPDRVIMLNNYRVGRWYPFADDSGYLTDPKTIVSVGALISLMGGRLDKLPGFRINVSELISKIVSTADNIGIYDGQTHQVEQLFFSPEDNRADLAVAGLPVMFGFKRFSPDNYPGRPIYKLSFNFEKISERIKNQYPYLSESELAEQSAQYLTQMKFRMPFQIRLSRQVRTNKEGILIETVWDKDRTELSSSLLTLSLQTLPEEAGYWLDTGEFQLNIRS